MLTVGDRFPEYRLQAVVGLDQAIAVDPRQPEFHSNLALAFAAVGELERAAGHCRQALALAPNLAEVHNNLGGIHKGMGLIDEAVASLRTFALIDRETIADERDPAITTDCIRLHRLVRQVAAVRRDSARDRAPAHVQCARPEVRQRFGRNPRR